jgi:hypothetical protein
VFLAGLRTIDRTRGSGWLDCPNCHEHASQDVVDEMRFVGLVGYRFTPLGRRRVLVCRRCSFRRPASEDELSRLNTGGRRIQPAWLVPIGLLPFVLAGGVALFLATRGGAGIEDTLTFTADSAQPVAPVSLRRPLPWNAAANRDSTPPDYTVSDPTQRMVIKLRRLTDSATLAQLLSQHYADDNGINDTGVPDSLPRPTQVRIAGAQGLRVRFAYTSTGEPAQTTFYGFFHNGIGYSLTYVAIGSGQFLTLDAVAEKVNTSLAFAGQETPAPCPSAGPSPTAAPSASPGATPPATFPVYATSPQPCAGGPAGSGTPAPASPTPQH